MKINYRILPTVIFAPLIFALSIILNLYVKNIGQLQIKMVITPIIFVMIFTFVCYFLFSYIYHDRTKSYVFTSFFIIIFFSYGDINHFFNNLHFISGPLHIGKNQLLSLLLTCAQLIFFFIIFRSKNDLFYIQKILATISAITIIFPSITFVKFAMAEGLKHEALSSLQLPNPQAIKHNINTYPDIYFILPEDYSSSGIFKRYLNTDISDFTDYLKLHDFYIAENSTSNYPKSFLSVGSMLNMEYLDYLSKYTKSSDLTIVNPLIENNNVLKFVKSIGYSYYQMGSWWSPTNLNQYADNNFILERESLGKIDEFSYLALKSTILSPIIDKLISTKVIGESEADKRARIIYQFNKLPEITKLPGPKFVFTHIIAPHEPYVFDSKCTWINYKITKTLSEEINYANQTKCINLKIENLISEILKNSVNDPVIIIQSDEGAPFIAEKTNPPDDWRTANSDLLKEKFPIFSAFHLPGNYKTKLYPSITPVNTFRIIFNLYFKADFQILPDRNFIFPDVHDLYRFTDVTDTIKKN